MTVINVKGCDVELTDYELRLFDALKPTEREVVLNYLNGMTPKESMSAANSKSPPSTVFNKPRVKSFINTVDHYRLASAVMSRDEMLRRLSAVARTKLDDVMEINTDREFVDMESGEVFRGDSVLIIKDPHEMSAAGCAAIKEISVTTRGTTIKLHDQTNAMKQISDILGYNAAQEIELTTRRSLEDFYSDLTGGSDDQESNT